MESVLAIEIPNPGDRAFAAASSVTTEVDGNGAAVCRHPQGGPVASGESVDGGYFVVKRGWR